MNEDDFYSAGMNEFQKIIQEYQEKFEQSRIEAAMMEGAEQLARDVRRCQNRDHRFESLDTPICWTPFRPEKEKTGK